MYKNLALKLGKYALEHRFLSPKQKNNELKRINLAISCSPTPEAADFCFLKIHRLSLDRIAVDTVLNSISKKQRKYILMRYQENATNYAIYCKLGIQKSVQMNYNKSVLLQIGNMLLYRPNPEDIFNPVRVINILNIIDSRLFYIYEHDFYHDAISMSWIKELEEYRRKYSVLLKMQMTVISSRENSSYKEIVKAKLINPLLTNKEISNNLHYSVSNISVFLKKWLIEYEKRCS